MNPALLPPIVADYSVSEDGLLSILGYQIEGVDVSSPPELRHNVAFYEELIPIFQNSSSSFCLFEKKKLAMKALYRRVNAKYKTFHVVCVISLGTNVSLLFPV
jgi:hypothetical protein